MGTFRDLVAWQKAMDLVDCMYAAARLLPKSELFCLSQQMRSAALSVPSNIAEGRGRYTAADQRHFYRQARASTNEIQTQADVAARQGFITDEKRDEIIKLAAEVARTINGLIHTLPEA